MCPQYVGHMLVVHAKQKSVHLEVLQLFSSLVKTSFLRFAQEIVDAVLKEMKQKDQAQIRWKQHQLFLAHALLVVPEPDQ